LRPLKFHPILKQTLWGGERLNPPKELAAGREARPGRDLIILYDRKPKTKKQPMKDLN